MAKKKKGKKAELEGKFLAVWEKYCSYLPEPVRQYRFHKKRLWKFDFAWPKYYLAVEIQGGVFMRRFGKGGRGGGHATALGQADDYEKFRAAQKLGWALLPFNTHELQEKLDKGKITKTGKKKRHRKFTIYNCVDLVAEFLEAKIREHKEQDDSLKERICSTTS